MSLDGQSRVHRQDLEEEGQLALEGVLDLGAQAGGEAGDPLSQRGLAHSVVFNLSITFGVSPHPQLEETQTGRQRSFSRNVRIGIMSGQTGTTSRCSSSSSNRRTSYLCVRFPILDDGLRVSADHQPGHLTGLAHLPPRIVLNHAGQWKH